MYHLLRAAFRRIFFLQASGIVRLGAHKVIAVDDMPPLPASVVPQNFAPAFLNLPTHSPWAFLWACIAALKKRLLVIIAIAGAMLCFEIVMPNLLYHLIQYVGQAAQPGSSLAYGVALASALVIASTVQALFMQHFFYQVLVSGQEGVNGLNHILYQKSLTLSRHARMQRPTGDIVNYMGTDAEAVAQFMWVIVDLGYSFCVIAACGLMLFNFIGPASLAAFAVLLLLAPFTKVLGERFIRIDDRLLQMRDQRVSLISQLLNGIRVIKYFTWEDKAIADVTEARERELKTKRKLVIAESCSLLLYIATNSLLGLATFSTYLWLGGELEAATVFASLALFSAMEHPFGNLTELISKIATAKVGAERIAQFLRADAPITAPRQATLVPSAYALTLSEVNARYQDADADVLHDLNLTVGSGEAIAIVGPVGCGKTSLLLSVLGELRPQHGELTFSPPVPAAYAPRIAWVPQEAFICNRSLRENILFGEHEGPLLDEAIALTCLGSDIEQMTGGLETEIGEQGINLSGGQKQRLSLARAHVYQAGLMLLDDPLSAVDETTEKHIFNELIMGAWRQTTRLVVTHRLAQLAAFDRVVYMEQGRIVAEGPFHELYRSSRRFARFYDEYSQHVAPAVPDGGPEADEPPRLSVSPADDLPKPKGAGTRLISDEDRVHGRVSPRVFLSYLEAMAGSSQRNRPLILAGLFFSVLAVALIPVAQNAWLSLWSSPTTATSRLSILERALRPLVGDSQQNILIYALLGILLLVAYFNQHLLWAFRSLMASRQMHAQAFAAVIGTRVRFFDSNPMGRILNRFSQDVDAVEKQLPSSFEQMIRSGMTVLVSLTVLVSVLPMMLIVIVPILGVYYHLQKNFRTVSREAKRLSSVTRSPRFAHFKETLEGLPVIRHLHKSELFTERFFAILDTYQRAFYGMILLNRWFSIRIPILSSFIAGAVTFAVIWAAQKGAISSGTAGLVLVYSLQLWGSLNWCIRCFSEAEARLISIERLRFFASLQPEASTSKAAYELLDWPRSGRIDFDEVSVAYADNLPQVLKRVSFTIASGQKVGLIGRTGAGKSTVLQLLYRFLPVTSGGIFIDGVNINELPLQQLRRQISIIPQAPTLFAGSLRKNLDWLDRHTDDELWQAIKRAHLYQFVNTRGGLALEIKENGENLSQGQRQLVCLARALLIDSPIIVMDEATASVDVATDQLIQRTINEECQGKTVIVIAHRLATLTDCDMMIELADGQVKAISYPKAARAWEPTEAGTRVLRRPLQTPGTGA